MCAFSFSSKSPQKKVANEIEERQRFLLQARESGIPREVDTRIMAEISQRMSELKRLTPS